MILEVNWMTYQVIYFVHNEGYINHDKATNYYDVAKLRSHKNNQ